MLFPLTSVLSVETGKAQDSYFTAETDIPLEPQEAVHPGS